MPTQNQRDQRETVKDKGGTTSGPRGIQMWNDDEPDEPGAAGADPAGGQGNASEGTAGRQARIGRMADKPPPEDGSP